MNQWKQEVASIYFHVDHDIASVQFRVDQEGNSWIIDIFIKDIEKLNFRHKILQMSCNRTKAAADKSL